MNKCENVKECEHFEAKMKTYKDFTGNKPNLEKALEKTRVTSKKRVGYMVSALAAAAIAVTGTWYVITNSSKTQEQPTIEKLYTSINPPKGVENPPEETHYQQTTETSMTNLERALEVYRKIGFGGWDFDTRFNQIRSLEKAVLNPSEINEFLQTVLKEYGDELDKRKTEFYINCLLQDSYDAGNNNFVLNTGDSQMNHLGYMLKGTDEKKLEITIKGDVGYKCGYSSTNSSFTIEGNVREWCGKSSNNSSFAIRGNVGESCGDISKDSSFTIKGNVGYWCGRDSTNSSFTIEGDIENECGKDSKDSTFTIEGNVGNWCGRNSKQSSFTVKGNVGDECGRYSENSTFTIGGNVGKWCGEYSINSTFAIEGNAGEWFGGESKNSTFTIKGNVGYSCGQGSEHSSFTINGNAGHSFGASTINSTFTIEGNVGEPQRHSIMERCGQGSKNLTIKTHNKELYERLKQIYNYATNPNLELIE